MDRMLYRNVLRVASTSTTAETEPVMSQSAQQVQMLVDGQWTESVDGRFLPVENPANREIIAQTPRASQADVDRAVQAAARAFDQWKLVAPRASLNNSSVRFGPLVSAGAGLVPARGGHKGCSYGRRGAPVNTPG